MHHSYSSLVSVLSGGEHRMPAAAAAAWSWRRRCCSRLRTKSSDQGLDQQHAGLDGHAWMQPRIFLRSFAVAGFALFTAAQAHQRAGDSGFVMISFLRRFLRGQGDVGELLVGETGGRPPDSACCTHLPSANGSRAGA